MTTRITINTTTDPKRFTMNLPGKHAGSVTEIEAGKFVGKIGELTVTGACPVSTARRAWAEASA